MAVTAVLLAAAVAFFGGMSRNASALSQAVFVDEILSSNRTYPNENGLCCDYIELHNTSDESISLAGYGLTDTKKKMRFVFPEDAQIAPGGYYTLWCDGASTDMNISREKSERIFFVNPEGKALQTVDTLPCNPDEAMIYEGGRWSLCAFPSPGYENTQAGSLQYRQRLQGTGSIRFSEVMSGNTLYFHDGGNTCDWIELRNTSEREASLAGYYITDGEGRTLYVFPEDAVIGDFTLLYCSEELHGYAPFGISGTKAATYVLRSPDGTPADILCTSACPQNCSLIASDGTWTVCDAPTPGFSNDAAGRTAFLQAKGYENCPVRITELMADNGATLAQEKTFPDWIELTNFSGAPFDLGNWYLSDDGDAPGWQIPDAVLAPGESRVFFCGEGRTDFSLSAHGETIFLRTPLGTEADRVTYPALETDAAYSLTSSGEWEVTRYATPGVPNDEDYTRPCSGLVISELQTANNRYFDYGYNRYYDWLELRNLSDESVDLSDYFLSDDSKDPAMYRLPETVLEPGECFVVLCTGDASMTNSRYTCTNFALSSSRDTLYLFDKAGNPVDYTPIVPIPGDCSFGRLQSGCFGYFDNPTPGSANGEGYARIAPAPVTLTSGGLYDGVEGGMDIALSGEGDIYYTLGGDIPSTGSNLYTEPIHIDKTTVIRAISYRDGMLQSPIMTETYFLNEGHTLPVISLVSPEKGLFSNESGIYVKGNYTNYYQDWERAANISLYNADGTEFQLDCGLKMFGAGSRESCEKKSFKLLFNGRYDGDLSCDVFGDGDVTRFHSLVLRAGEDYRFGLIRDNLLETLAKQGCPTLMTQNCRPAILYINGRYWGIYTIKEHFSEEYYSSYTGFDPDSVTILRSPMTTTNPLRSLMIDSAYADMSSDDFLNRASEMVDLSSLIDWTIMQAYAGNNDINGNIRYIYSTEDGKWRWCYFDLDWSLYISGHFNEVLMPDRQYSLLPRNLLRNDTFRRMFCDRLAELSTTVLSGENVASVIDTYAAMLDPEVERDFARWSLKLYNWNYYIESMRSLVTEHDRCGELMDSLCRIMNISDSERQEYYEKAVERYEKDK